MSKKNLLLVSSPAIWPVIEFEIDILQSAFDDGYHVTYIKCNGGFNSCIANKEKASDIFNPFTCIRCKNKASNALNILENKNNLTILNYKIDFDDVEFNNIIINLENEFKFIEVDVNKIKEIVDINGIDIFNSALSTLMTTLKDSKPNLFKYKKLLFDYLLEGLNSYFFYKELFKIRHFDRIIIFNGRVSRYRPILRLCKINNLDFEVLEYPEYSFDKYILTPNQYPHDFSYRSKILRKFVDESSLNTCEKIKIGKELIEDSINHRERHGIGIGNFVKNQLKDNLPINWNPNLFNIVIFTSSDFENAGIPEYYEKLFNCSQSNTIRALRDLLPNEFHFIIRIHPNQKDKDLSSAKELENLQSDNITVVKSYEAVDSYFLARQSNLVITFGSQLSVESAYMGKTVIVFGNSYYDYFKFTFNVGNDIFLASKLIFEFKNLKLVNMENDNLKKDEACLHMFARKYQGVDPKYLKKNSYYGGEFFINNQVKKIKIDKDVYFITKYLGFPIVFINEFKKGGFKSLVSLIKKI